MLQDRAIDILAQHRESAFTTRGILVIHDMEQRRWDREQRRRVNDFYNDSRRFGFDIFLIRWLFENRMGKQAHPEGDWYHPAWASPEGIIAAYDAD